MNLIKGKVKKILFVVTGSLVLLITLFIYIFIKIPIEKKKLYFSIQNSVTIYDRYEKKLAKFFPDMGGSYIPVKYTQLPRHLIHALISCEDKRFFQHYGVDMLALLRAIRDNVRFRYIVSGGSTLTQQLIRNIYRQPRNYRNKFYEMLLALRFDYQLSKKEILNLYLNRAYFGNSLYGIGSAAGIYFGKRVEDLSISESAFLVGILKSGIKYDPYVQNNKTESRRRYVLERMLKNGYISKRDCELSLHEGVKLNKTANPFQAPHFCFYVKDKVQKKKFRTVSEIHTTLDLSIQKKTEGILRNNLSRIKNLNVNNGACVVLDAKTAEVLAMVGSLNYFNRRNEGQVNGATSLRQPGSSLKPFLYAYIFNKGHAPADVIGDIKTEIPTMTGDYSPINFDKKYHGPVSIREALACSYNIPAVRWLYKYSVMEYVDLLRIAGLESIKKNPAYYGVGIALGTAEISLLKLANAYTVFANEGFFLPSRSISYVKLRSEKSIHWNQPGKQNVLDENIVYLINDILTDRNTKLKAFPNLRGIIYPFNIAMKTGTSKDYRDAWVVGYTRDYIVGIWIGNFDGKPMNRITGGNSAIPILLDIFLELNPKSKPTKFNRPERVITKTICPDSGLLASSNCPVNNEEIFIKNYEQKKICDQHALYVKNDGGKTEKVFTILPVEYDKWARENDIEHPDSQWIPVKEYQNNIDEVEVLYPDNGDIFRIDPVLPLEFQKIEFKANVPAETEYIEWYINNKLITKVSGQEKYKWILTRGKYSIHAKASLKDQTFINSKPINIIVQ